MSFHVFLSEGADTAIYEVGLGGEFDGTNIVEKPAVTGITSLGIDHVFTLGETIEEIAWHKAGIFKEGVKGFSVEQKEGAMRVIKERAEERKVKSFEVVGEDDRLEGVRITPMAQFQRLNASLAVALTETALKKVDPKYRRSKKKLSKELKLGLQRVVFRGRFEIIKKGRVVYYLDGAHTAESIEVATEWFKDEVQLEQFAREKGYWTPNTRVLLFNQQGDHDAIQLLEGLYNKSQSEEELHFDHVIFCPTRNRNSQTGKKGK